MFFKNEGFSVWQPLGHLLLVVFSFSTCLHIALGYYWKEYQFSLLSGGAELQNTNSTNSLELLIGLFLEKSCNHFIFFSPCSYAVCFNLMSFKSQKLYLNSHIARGLPNKAWLHTPSCKESGFEKGLGVASKNNTSILSEWEDSPVWKVFHEIFRIKFLIDQQWQQACTYSSKETQSTLSKILKMSWGKIMNDTILPSIWREVESNALGGAQHSSFIY